MKRISLIIIDDHMLIRQTWSFILNNDPRFIVLAECGSAEEGIELCRQHQPDILLLDINLPGMNGFDALPFIRQSSLATKILGISLHSQPTYVRKMMQNGATGYVTKNSTRAEMIQALIAVSEGKRYICNEIKNILANDMANPETNEKSIHSLSLREMEVIRMITQGFSSREIADRLSVSLKTVEVHRYNILKKLNLRNSAALVNYMNKYSYALG